MIEGRQIPKLIVCLLSVFVVFLFSKCNKRRIYTCTVLSVYCLYSICVLPVYQLQQEAPTPFPVPCEDRPPDSPPYYGQEYHGTMGRHQCQELLCREGSYLVRHSDTSYGFYTLSLR